VPISRGMIQVAVFFPISLFHTTMTSTNTTNSNAGAQISIPPPTDSESNTAAVASNIDFKTVILSLTYAPDSTGTAQPSLSVLATEAVEETLWDKQEGTKAAQSIRDIDTFYADMLNCYPAGSEGWQNSLRNGLKERIKYHNDTKEESDLGLSFADGSVADQYGELDELYMEAIVEQADSTEETDKEREERDAPRLEAEDREIAKQERQERD
jgi:hypothetical protein